MAIDEGKLEDWVKDTDYRLDKIERAQKKATSKIKRLEEDKADKRTWRA